MYTRRKRCLPIFHSTSTTSKPSERATRSAASRIFSKFTQRLPGLGRLNARYHRQQQKSGLAPTSKCDPLQSEVQVYSRSTVKARYRGPPQRGSAAMPLHIPDSNMRWFQEAGQPASELTFLISAR